MNIAEGVLPAAPFAMSSPATTAGVGTATNMDCTAETPVPASQMLCADQPTMLAIGSAVDLDQMTDSIGMARNTGTEDWGMNKYDENEAQKGNDTLDDCESAPRTGKRKLGRPLGSKKKQQVVNEIEATTETGLALSRPKRRTVPPERWQDMIENPGEQMQRKAKLSQPAFPVGGDMCIPEAPTFFPSCEEFRDPLRYIESIRERGMVYGIAKIVPPKGWNPPKVDPKLHALKVVPTKKQALHNLGNEDEVFDDGHSYRVEDYEKMAEAFAAAWANRETRERNQDCGHQESKPHSMQPEPLDAGADSDEGQLRGRAGQGWGGQPVSSIKVEMDQEMEDRSFGEKQKKLTRLQELEKEYWNVVDKGSEECVVEYANDLDTGKYWSGFPAPPEGYMEGQYFHRDGPMNFDDPNYYKTSGWNLNNLPFWPGSVLRWYRTHVNGLTLPWLYLGMQFATFAWHNEDNYLYSMNYHHGGAPKQWYGVPGHEAGNFEKCLANVLGQSLVDMPDILYHITKMLSPMKLRQHQVPVCRLLQEEGEFVVTFPKAYHSGFSYGHNCGEAVNFAVPDWIPYSRESTEAYRSVSRPAALSHEKMVVILTMYLPDHSLQGCEMVVKELQRILNEQLLLRGKLEKQGVIDPAKTTGQTLPSFQLGFIEQDSEDYDEKRACKVCAHVPYMTCVACNCSETDVTCLRCAEKMCDCPITERYLLCWWKKSEMQHMVYAAQSYLGRLRARTANAEAVARFHRTINPFEQGL